MTPAQRFAAVVSALPERAQAPLRRAWAQSSPEEQLVLLGTAARLYGDVEGRPTRNAAPSQLADTKKPWARAVALMRIRYGERYGLVPGVGGVPKMTRLEAAALALELYETGRRQYGAEGQLAKEWRDGGIKAVQRSVWPGDSPGSDWLEPAASLFGWRKEGDAFQAMDGNDTEWMNAPADIATLWSLWGAWEKFGQLQDGVIAIGTPNNPELERFEPTPQVWRRLFGVVFDTLKRRIPGLKPMLPPPRAQGSSSLVLIIAAIGAAYLVTR